MKSELKEQLNSSVSDNGRKEIPTPVKEPVDMDIEKWLDSLETVLEYGLKGNSPERVAVLFNKLTQRLQESGIKVPPTISTPYINTIPVEEQPAYPGDREIERKIKSYARWNAMAMVVKANREHSGIGGHISTYASCATLYEVGFNHFFRGGNGD